MTWRTERCLCISLELSCAVATRFLTHHLPNTMSASEGAIEKAQRHSIVLLLVVGGACLAAGWKTATSLYSERLNAKDSQIARLQEDTSTLATLLREACGSFNAPGYGIRRLRSRLDSICTTQGIAPNPGGTQDKHSAGTEKRINMPPAFSGPPATSSDPVPTPAETSLPVGCATYNSFQCAMSMTPGAVDSDVFGRESRFYRFTLDHPRQVRLTLNPMPNSRYVNLYLFDVNYSRIHFKQFDAGQPGTVTQSLRPGLYYVQLDPGSCCTGAPYNYSFSVSW